LGVATGKYDEEFIKELIENNKVKKA